MGSLGSTLTSGMALEPGTHVNRASSSVKGILGEREQLWNKGARLCSSAQSLSVL